VASDGPRPVDRRGDLAEKTSVTQTTAGNLQAEIDKELAEAESGKAKA